MTNGDKIRQRYANASDAELFKWCIDGEEKKCPPDMEHGDKCPYDEDEATWDDCDACWLRWLGEEADDD